MFPGTMATRGWGPASLSKAAVFDILELSPRPIATRPAEHWVAHGDPAGNIQKVTQSAPDIRIWPNIIRQRM